MRTNSPIAAVLTLALAFVVWWMGGWASLGVFVLGFIWGAWGTIWNAFRADAIRPRGEWADEPVHVRDWVS